MHEHLLMHDVCAGGVYFREFCDVSFARGIAMACGAAAIFGGVYLLAPQHPACPETDSQSKSAHKHHRRGSTVDAVVAAGHWGSAQQESAVGGDASSGDDRSTTLSTDSSKACATQHDDRQASEA